MYKVECPRCSNGKGVINAFRHVKGGVCFKCDGVGYVEVKTNPESLIKAKIARREKAQLALRAKMEAALEVDRLREEKYKNDSRIGPKTRERCAQHEALAHEVYLLLERIDSGEYAHGPNAGGISE